MQPPIRVARESTDIQTDKHTETRSGENGGRDMRKDSIKIGKTIYIKVKNGLIEDNNRKTPKKFGKGYR